MIGTNRPRPLLLLELCAGVELTDAAALDTIREALAAANAGQPSYSHVLPQHVMLLPEDSLPKTVKGGVQRVKAEAAFKEEIDALAAGRYAGAKLVSASSSGAGGGQRGGVAYDSLAVAGSGGGGAGGSDGSAQPNFEFLSGLRFVLALWVIIRHFTYPTRLAGVGTPLASGLVGYVDNAIDRAGVAVNAFFVTGGFGIHLTHASDRQLFSSGWRSLKVRSYASCNSSPCLTQYMAVACGKSM